MSHLAESEKHFRGLRLCSRVLVLAGERREEIGSADGLELPVAACVSSPVALNGVRPPNVLHFQTFSSKASRYVSHLCWSNENFATFWVERACLSAHNVLPASKVTF